MVVSFFTTPFFRWSDFSDHLKIGVVDFGVIQIRGWPERGFGRVTEKHVQFQLRAHGARKILAITPRDPSKSELRILADFGVTKNRVTKNRVVIFSPPDFWSLRFFVTPIFRHSDFSDHPRSGSGVPDPGSRIPGPGVRGPGTLDPGSRTPKMGHFWTPFSRIW